MRSIVYTLLIISFFWGCDNAASGYQKITGRTMGTSYHITYLYDGEVDIAGGIDLLLRTFNQSLSTYIRDSHISMFNKSSDTIVFALDNDPYFLPVLELSKKIHNISGKSFDPTIMPLVNFYGFGYEKKKPNVDPDMEKLDSVKLLVDLDQVSFFTKDDSFYLVKSHPNVELDFSSIAKGYGVDVVASYLEENEIQHYLVEIGGEVRTKGKSPRNKLWVLGINTPDPMAAVNDILLPIHLNNKSLATSGDYRNFYITGKQKYVHIIDPISGKSEESDLLSASIVAPTCAEADALATACIVKGLASSVEMIESIPQVEACFITGNEDGDDYNIHYTSGFKKMIND